MAAMPFVRPKPKAVIEIDVLQYLEDCPPYDNPIDKSLLPAIAEEIARRFDCEDIYTQIDELCCFILRDQYNIEPSAN